MITPCLTLAFLLGDQSPMELFKNGGPIMWPILLLSLVGFTVVIERLIFIARENNAREPEVVEKILEKVEARDIDGAVEVGRQSKYFVARILTYALSNKDLSLSNAFIRAANQEMTRFNQGLATLDTVITAAPLPGLLGTVTGMMRTVGALGTGDVGANAGQITGGVAEALIATCCGLFIAVTCLFPYNYLNARAEQAKNEISDASHALEILMKKAETHNS